MDLSGFKPMAAGWKAQMNPLNYLILKSRSLMHLTGFKPLDSRMVGADESTELFEAEKA